MEAESDAKKMEALREQFEKQKQIANDLIKTKLKR